MEKLEENYSIRSTMLPYGKQTIDKHDINAVIKVLEEDNFLTTGPLVDKFEQLVCEKFNIKYAVAVSNGTAALHCAMIALNLNKEDEIIVTCLSFAASSNCVLYCGAKPIFCDIEEGTMNIDPNKIEALITSHTKALIVVDFAGQLCDYSKIKGICNKYNLVLIRDAAHSFGIQEEGNVSDLTTFSFHPVKNITTGEGGMIVTNNPEYYDKLKMARNHGIDVDYKKRRLYEYDITSLGYNYRLTDIQCALGISQMDKLDSFIKKRRYIAHKYNEAFEEMKDKLEPLAQKFNTTYHIYVIKLKNCNRDEVFQKLKAKNIGVNVHYKPIYLHTLYQNLGYEKGLCPVAEDIYQRIITLPLFPKMSDKDINNVVNAIKLCCC